MRGSREISLVPSLHRASTDALICTETTKLLCMNRLICSCFLAHYASTNSILCDHECLTFVKALLRVYILRTKFSVERR